MSSALSRRNRKEAHAPRPSSPLGQSVAFTTPLVVVILINIVCCARTETPSVARQEPFMPLFAHPGECRDCHEDLAGGVALGPPPANVCSASGCHDDLRVGPGFVHGPVARGDCSICHLPHSSHRESLVVAAPAPLCRSCHDALVTCAAREAPAESDCNACHLPHAGADHRLLREQPYALDVWLGRRKTAR